MKKTVNDPKPHFSNIELNKTLNPKGNKFSFKTELTKLKKIITKNKKHEELLRIRFPFNETPV